jgi:hypothetical protein
MENFLHIINTEVKWYQKGYFGKLAQVIDKNNHNNGAALVSMISYKMLL